MQCRPISRLVYSTTRQGFESRDQSWQFYSGWHWLCCMGASQPPSSLSWGHLWYSQRMRGNWSKFFWETNIAQRWSPHMGWQEQIPSRKELEAGWGWPALLPAEQIVNLRSWRGSIRMWGATLTNLPTEKVWKVEKTWGQTGELWSIALPSFTGSTFTLTWRSSGKTYHWLNFVDGDHWQEAASDSSSPPPRRFLSRSSFASLQVPLLPMSQKFSFFLLKVKSSAGL